MVFAVCAAAASAAAALYLLQDRMLFHPPQPFVDVKGLLPKKSLLLKFDIELNGGKAAQQCYYIPPADGRRVPRFLWALFGGNGSQALGWLELVQKARIQDPSAGFLLVEYPGYGHSKGRPSLPGMLVASEGAFKELARRLDLPESTLEERLGTVAHSLGCAASLQFAVRHPVRRVVLAAPFTSLADVARGRVGWPLVLLLRHHADNRAMLRSLLAREEPPAVTIIHGSRDVIVPTRMGRELASISQDITCHQVEGAGHNDIPLDGPQGLLAAMR